MNSRRDILKGLLVAPFIKLRGGIKPMDPVPAKVLTPVISVMSNSSCFQTAFWTTTCSMDFKQVQGGWPSFLEPKCEYCDQVNCGCGAKQNGLG